ncbi:hypothetical protein K7432_017524 [Basidiobolus ranarum]|uniref:C2H2-type domain-containing protein n=1 Tax=Basidiobolus ranarum TaxID=34480 RepID=A0ABR2VLD8_9FUNG
MSTSVPVSRPLSNNALPSIRELFSGEAWYSQPSEFPDSTKHFNNEHTLCAGETKTWKLRKVNEISKYPVLPDDSMCTSRSQQLYLQTHISTSMPESKSYNILQGNSTSDRQSSISSNTPSESSVAEYIPGQRNYVAKRHICYICFKRFPRPSSLRIHLHTHTGEKPYECQYSGCRRRFSVLSNLRRHHKTHTT